ncbi:MAG: PHP domain-containing protein [Butyrivibrio sp.]|uniref:PHP domain-containing protein n=1 Tax=Butyrivibrio sp. TaxID=28121 RepID=UPI0025D45532|nr:PHP domain-containing protein [Butyrivibrio sp.]MCR5770710.1 PHP domain-containing protein [Butyrivibrio sp.]
MRAVDLHTHSTASDGTYTPAQLIDYAHQKNLAAIALTDHDTTKGLAEAMAQGQKYDDLEVIPGIEFSTDYEGKDIHIVGLYMHYDDPEIQKRLQEFVDSRVMRNRKMCRLLTEHGVPMDFDELQAAFPDSVITRAHYAAYMLDKGYIKSRQEAFDRYIGDNCECFVPREKITPVMAVKMILDAGGAPILAHPILYGMSDDRLRKLVGELKEVGLMGIEAIYTTYTASDERQIRKIAEDYDLLISGGSDFHGDNKPGIDLGVGYGKLFIPESALDKIKEALNK